MRRLSIGRLIAVIFAVTVVSLFSIDTTSACRLLWRTRCYTPVYCCPPAYEVVSDSNCCSDVIYGESVDATTHLAPEAMNEVPATPVPADPPAMEIPDQAAESALDDTPPMPDQFDETPIEAADSIIDDVTIPGDEPAIDLPSDDAGDLGVFDEPAADDAGTDDGLPPMPDQSTDVFSDPLPDDSPADDTGIDEFLPGDDIDLPADDGFPADDVPADGPEDDLDDLFSETAPADGDDARVANNPEDEVDDLFEDIDVEESTDLPSDADTDVPDDLFPADDADALPSDTDDLPSDAGDDDDLDDLFGKAPTNDGTELGFRETQPAKIAVKVTKTVEQNKVTPLFRVWTDNTGGYKTVGQLVTISDTHIRLLKDNGRFSTVPKRRLSDNDLAYVHRMAKQMGTEAIEKIASR